MRRVGSGLGDPDTIKNRLDNYVRVAQLYVIIICNNLSNYGILAPLNGIVHLYIGVASTVC